ncbi:MAG TPA: type II secretion system F family protein [Oscillatoriaceae cyanobacterium]
MNPIMLLAIAAGVFALVFGALLVVSKRVSQAPDGAEAAEAKREAFALRLKRAGIEIEPETYQKRVRFTAIGAAAFGLVVGGFGLGGAVFGGLLAFGALRGGDAYVDFRHRKRLGDFVDQFADALGVMANGVKSGQTILQTLETVADDFADPLRGEVLEVLQELRMGVPMDNALEQWNARMPCEDLSIATTALIVQRTTGGNVSEILETLATTIRDRNKLHKQIQSLTAQGRMSGWVMSALPVVLFLAFYLISPQRTGLLLSNPFGLVLTAFGAGMIGVGSYVIRRIVTIEV